jgi:hypothetical protein
MASLYGCAELLGPSGGAVSPSPSERCIISESVHWPNLKPIDGK